MTPEIKAIILAALELKEASVKRASNTAKNPAFKPIYDLELEQCNDARKWINAQK